MTAWRIVCGGPLPAAAPFAALGIELCTALPAAPARHTWFPAAGVVFNADTAARLFAVCEHLQCDLAQPAFARDARALHAVARVHEGFQLRFTSLVDPAAPVLSARLLQQAGAPAARDAAQARAWAEAAGAGRCVVVDAVPVAGHGSAPDPLALEAFNLGGLLATGDGCCLDDGPGAAAGLLAWVLQANRDLPAGPLARYLAAHLVSPHAGLPARLEAALTEAGIGFNRVPVSPPEAAPAAASPAASPAALPSASPSASPSACLPAAVPASAPLPRDAQRLAADLHDLRERHARLLAERERQAALLAALAAELRRAGAPA